MSPTRASIAARRPYLPEVGQDGPAARLWRDDTAIPLCDSLRAEED
jgi:hypothetical protein